MQNNVRCEGELSHAEIKKTNKQQQQNKTLSKLIKPF